MNKEIGYIELLKTNPSYRDDVMNSLCGNGKLIYSSEIRDFLDNFLEVYMDKFKKYENKYLYEDEDEIITLILPMMKRVYYKVFISPPSLISNKKDKLELYTLSFVIEEFCEYLLDMISSSEKILEKFQYLDKTIEFMNLLVENYIAFLVDKVYKTENINEEIRNYKLNKILSNERLL